MISIDIGTHSIKFLELKTAKKHGLVVKNIDIEYVNSPIGSNFLDDNIKESFNKLITRYKLKNKSINICISDCFLLNKHIENNTGIFDDIEKKINEEADNYFPIAEKERMIVFKPLSNTGIKKELGKAEVYNVLIGAVNKIYILNLLSFLKSNKIKVKSLGAGPVSLVTAHLFNSSESAEDLCLYMDTGFISTRIIFVRNGIMLYAGSIPVAGKFFTSEISKKLNIPFDRAEIFKIRFGNEILCSKDKIEIDVTETLKSALDIWESEVKNNLVEFYKFFDKKLKPKEIILSGGSSHLKDIHARLKIIFNCPVKNINTFERIKLGHDIREKSKQINEYFFANCVGMSICNTFNIPIAINLLPREIRIKRLITYRYAYVAAFLLTIIFGVITEKYLSPFLFSSKKGQNKNISIPSEQSSYSKSVPGYFKKFKTGKKFNDIIVSSIKVLPEKTYFEDIFIQRKESGILLEVTGRSEKKVLIENYEKLIKNTFLDSTEIIMTSEESDGKYPWHFKLKFFLDNQKNNLR